MAKLRSGLPDDWRAERIELGTGRLSLVVEGPQVAAEQTEPR
jgi:hypothetical protein